MNTQKAATWFGYVTLAIGILGFIPGVVNDTGVLFGLFQFDQLHNVIFVITGLVGIAAAAGFRLSKNYFKVFGSIYLLLTVLGLFLANGIVLGMMMNTADNVLHLIIAAFALYYGFRKEGTIVM